MQTIPAPRPIEDVAQHSPAGEIKFTHIYALIDPRNGKPFYVGKADKPEERLLHHITIAKEWKRWRENGDKDKDCLHGIGNSQKHQRVTEILDAQLKPLVKILEQCPIWVGEKEFWRERERWWEEEHLRLGFVLLNGAACGAGGGTHSEWTKGAISRALKASPKLRAHNDSHIGKPLSPEHRAAVSAGIRSSPNFKAYWASRKGVKLPPGSGAKISAALKASPKVKANGDRMRGVKRPDITAKLTGSKRTPEQKARMGAALRASPIFQAKMKERRGKPFPPEHRANMMAAQRSFFDMVKEVQIRLGFSFQAAKLIVKVSNRD